MDWEEPIDLIRHHAAQLAAGDPAVPTDNIEDVEFARKSLRASNRDLWKVINRLDAIVLDEERDAVARIAAIAETNGETFAHRLEELIAAGIVELKADYRRLRKEEQ